MKMQIKVTGLKETIDAMKKVPDKIAKNATRRAVRAGLIPIRDLARTNLLAHIKTGALSRSLRISTRYDRATGNVTGKLSHSRDTYYGRFLEFGTRRQRPARWLGAAFDAGAVTGVTAFTEKLRSGFDEALRQP